MALFPLVEMGTAPPIVPGYDMLWPIIRFSHRHVYSDNCSCPVELHSRAMAVIRLSCACKCTECWCYVKDFCVLCCTDVYWSKPANQLAYLVPNYIIHSVLDLINKKNKYSNSEQIKKVSISLPIVLIQQKNTTTLNWSFSLLLKRQAIISSSLHQICRSTITMAFENKSSVHRFMPLSLSPLPLLTSPVPAWHVYLPWSHGPNWKSL